MSGCASEEYIISWLSGVLLHLKIKSRHYNNKTIFIVRNSQFFCFEYIKCFIVLQENISTVFSLTGTKAFWMKVTAKRPNAGGKIRGGLRPLDGHLKDNSGILNIGPPFWFV